MSKRWSVVAGVWLVLLAAGCGGPQQEVGTALCVDQVFQVGLGEVRLGDGVPLSLNLSVRWRIENREAFLAQFAGPDKYGELVLRPKAREIAGRVANRFPKVESVFKADRERFHQEMKKALRDGLGEKAIRIKDVTLADIVFPPRFTEAMEQVALKSRELEAIQQRNAVDVEAAKAAEKTAEAEGQIQIKKAEIEGRVAEINARTEDKRRTSLMARAETESQIDERRARTEATRQKLLAGAEAERQKLLASAEADRQRELAKVKAEDQKALNELAVQKQRDLELVAIEKDKAVAQLCAANPAYASFIINRELASKVQIAVLPLGTDTNFLGGLMQSGLAAKAEPRSSR